MKRMQLASITVASWLMCAGALSLIPSPSSATYVYIFTENFDGDWPPDFYIVNPIPGSWKVVDNNAASGIDYWGRTSYKSQGGTYSAWCAQNGVNSINYQANSFNHYYDQDMQSCMMVYLGNIEGYSAVYVSFAYWAKTGTESPNDHLELRAFTGSAWVDLWTQPNVGNMTWEWVTKSLPASTIWVGWFFFSDAEVGSGPYEGVYVDSIQIAGNDVNRPSSSAGPLEQYQVGDIIYVPYSATDSFGSGVKSVELYYRVNSSGSFLKYSPPENPSGEWTSGMIAFNATPFGRDGIYEFYTLASDNALNKELAPGSADAYAILDNSLPLTEAAVVEHKGIKGWYATNVHLYLSAYDTGSGVDSTAFRIDAADWMNYSDGIVLDADGIHLVEFWSQDRAGNKEQVRTLEICVDKHAPLIDVTGPPEGAELESGDVLVSWECSDETSGVDRVIITIDDTLSEYCNASARNLPLSGLGAGDHELVVTVYDLAGNSAEVALEFTVLSEDDLGGAAGLWNATTIAGMMVLLAMIIAVLLMLLRRRGASRQGSLAEEGERREGPEAQRRELAGGPTREERPMPREESLAGEGDRRRGPEAQRRDLPSAPSKDKKPQP